MLSEEYLITRTIHSGVCLKAFYSFQRKIQVSNFSSPLHQVRNKTGGYCKKSAVILTSGFMILLAL